MRWTFSELLTVNLVTFTGSLASGEIFRRWIEAQVDGWILIRFIYESEYSIFAGNIRLFVPATSALGFDELCLNSYQWLIMWSSRSSRFHSTAYSLSVWRRSERGQFIDSQYQSRSGVNHSHIDLRPSHIQFWSVLEASKDHHLKSAAELWTIQRLSEVHLRSFRASFSS